MTKDVLREAIFFADRSRKYTRFVFDDYPKYNMSLIAKVLEYYDFKVIESGKNKCLMEKNA
jgi:peptidoglycan/xylan/chitin deacetylase (PgdA/CDA1 family)